MDQDSSYYLFQIKWNKIISPNNWIEKAWWKIEDLWDSNLPQASILIPMSTASKAVEKYNSTKDYNEKIELSLLIALTIRIAETSFYNNFTKVFTTQWVKVCHHCIRKSDNFNNKEVLKYRQLCNEKIIHHMENNIMIDPIDLDLSIKYYDAVLRLPLLEIITIDKAFSVQVCDNCKKLNKELITSLWKNNLW